MVLQGAFSAPSCQIISVLGHNIRNICPPQRQDLLWFSEGQGSTKDNPICAGNLYLLSDGSLLLVMDPI